MNAIPLDFAEPFMRFDIFAIIRVDVAAGVV